VLVDTRRLEVSFDVMGRLEERGVPFIVAVNSFPDAPRYPLDELRTALDLTEEIPIVECDVRRRASSKEVLMTLMHFLHSLAMSGALT
jgi:signal recognition particle receptor subunit beta